MVRFRRILFFIFILFLGILPSSDAYKVSNLEFQDVFKRGPVELSLRGAGLKKFLSVRVAAAALYLKKDTDAKDILKDIPKSLEVIFLQNIPAIELQRATTKGIRLNISDQEFERLSPRIDILNSYFPSVKKMDRIQMTYLPGKGTIIEVNGVVEGVIPGIDFGGDFFAIWVGDKPVDPFMKKVLLGKIKQRD